MSKTEVKDIISRYAKALADEKYAYSKIYLFGSYAKGSPNKWSDIDVAVVTNKLKRNYEKNRAMLRKISMNVDERIEPHGFTEEGFENNADPLAYEIRKTGILQKT